MGVGVVSFKHLPAPRPTGLASWERASAMRCSGRPSKTVTQPLDAEAYALKLQELIAGSRFVKKTVASDASDFAASFRR